MRQTTKKFLEEDRNSSSSRSRSSTWSRSTTWYSKISRTRLPFFLWCRQAVRAATCRMGRVGIPVTTDATQRRRELVEEGEGLEERGWRRIVFHADSFPKIFSSPLHACVRVFLPPTRHSSLLSSAWWQHIAKILQDKGTVCLSINKPLQMGEL
jgi:hypothetical protein